MEMSGGRRSEAEDVMDVRENLLSTAVGMFSEKGFSGTSIRDIAKVHGVSLSNIYYHFGNKDGLWREILDRSVRLLPDRLRAAVAAAGTPRAALEALVRAHLAAAVEYRRELLMLLAQRAQLAEDVGNETAEIQREVLDIYSEVLDRLGAEGALNSGHARVTAFNMLGVINWHLRWYRPDGPLPAETVHQEIVDFIMRGACRD
ncbi:TetR/AcrR family transcriptional regulator [Rhizobium sp. S-51]|uniref:TetR/AcrR family transcriptional regulator n=1 Tax=Rhizobium terricola TaxID=2728849 RepID=A0A7Y0AWJ2_9HYPH|nr:TetR family transcriptional regulator [Rhizobium terricola]NML74809.1 TetR/AcrR family transcriptional regulator [Rhizobium terricola]